MNVNWITTIYEAILIIKNLITIYFSYFSKRKRLKVIFSSNYLQHLIRVGETSLKWICK